MCGIVGIASKNSFSSSELIEALKRLEYRGYDSAGIAAVSDRLICKKRAGRIRNLEGLAEGYKANVGIGHTRWATTGSVTDANAHPHLDCKGKIAIVHNGIIENYNDLKKELIEKGHKFVSETDSEAIAHLIEEHLKEGWENALNKTASLLQGRNAFVAITKSGDMGIFKKGSPLAIGIDDDSFYIASDALPFLEKTRKFIFLEDGDLVTIDDKIKFVLGKEKQPKEIDWDVEKATKGKYPHFLIKEIMEQPNAIKAVFEKETSKINKIARMINNSFGSYFVACGTASCAALASSYFFSKIAKIHINFAFGSEFSSCKHFLTEKSLVLAISQSGETADTLEAIKTAKEVGAKTVGIVNVPGSSIMRQSDYSLLTNSGPEIAVASTKAFISQLSLTMLLAYAAADSIEEGRALLEKVFGESKKLLTEDYIDKIKSLAKNLSRKEHLYVIGKGLNYPIALEAAIKIMEVSRIHATGLASGELKHYALSLIEKGTPCIAIIANDEVKQDVLSGAAEVKARGGYIIGIAPENSSVFDIWLPVPDVGNASPITNVIPLQLLAYYLAIERGCDPDYCKNLAKCVTVK